MQVAKILISENQAVVKDLKTITSGTVGATVDFEFDETWDGFTKTYVYRAGYIVRDDTKLTGIIPHEVMAKSGIKLEVGVYGIKDDVEIPTVWASLGKIIPGTNPSGDQSTNKFLPVWAQLQQGVEAADQKAEELQKNLGKAVQIEPQDFTEEQQAQARENIGISDNPDIHAEYFTITDDGVVSLKPEYRGATNKADYANDVSDMGVGVVGSKNAELPKNLVIPEIVDEKAVHSLALAIFRYNYAVVNVTLPNTITEIPKFGFDNCLYLKNVYNTRNIKSIGMAAFQKAGIVRINCPNLEQLTSASFVYCNKLVYANIGKVTALPVSVFDTCLKLNMVTNENTIASVGKRCFFKTPNLKHADFVSGLTEIGEIAFLRSGVDCDWASLSGCTFGANATPLQYNPTDYWSSCTFTPCENRVPTHLCQRDERWADRQIGATGKTYGANGCAFFAIMHSYCGLHNLSLTTVTEMEEVINSINADWLNNFSTSNNNIEAQAEGLGLSVERYATFDNTNLQALYDALADGKYAIITYDEPQVSAHVVVIYGINANGELLVADSEVASYTDGQSEPLKYALPIYKLGAQANTNGNYKLNIVSL